MNENEEKQDSSDDVVEAAKKCLTLAEEAESDSRTESEDDVRFSAGEQWPQDVKNERTLDGRPCLTVNRIPQFIRQITNDQRQNRPSIKVHPVDNKADIDTAKTLQGMIKHVEYNSNADIAYDTAFDGAVRKGFGFFRVITDYCNPMSFDQDIKIVPVADDFTTFIDPFSKLPDGSDASWGLTFQDVPHEQYKLEYPKSELTQNDDWSQLGKTSEGWVQANSCRVAEFFRKEYKEQTIVQLPDGQVLTLEEAKATELGEQAELLPKRQTMIPIIMWYKLNGIEILDKTEWPGRWIPIIPVYGDILYVNGKRILEGVVRHAKDPQRMLNYWASTETEAIALAPKAPFLVARGSIPEEAAEKWATANKKTHAYLEYETEVDGRPVPPPQRNSFEPAVMAITNARMQSSQDLKDTTGIQDAAMGIRSNEQSGIAIQRRAAQSQTSNFHFIDNLTRSIKHCGRILVDLIPKVYDTERAVRIIGDDGEQEIVAINQLFEDGTAKNYLGYGEYDVAVDTGPNYATRRQEAVANMLELVQAMPQAAQILPDLIVGNMDMKDAKEAAARLKKLVPPGIIEEAEGPAPLPPEAQAHISQLEQMNAQMSERLAQFQSGAELKQMEIESKERIETLKLQNQLVIEEMKLKGESAMETFRAELRTLNGRLDLLDINQEFDQDLAAQMPDQQMTPEQQQLTGEFPPGLPMES